MRAPVRVTYEAGPTGFGLARAINEAGMECVVAAPSKLQRPAGDRVKTDARDAAHLARLLRLGEITAVRVPEREIEAVRDLVRAREDARADLMRVRHRLSKLLLRQGIVYYGGTPWTCAHEEWLRRHRFDDIHLKPKLRRLGNANPWLSWGLPLFGVVVSDYAALSGIAVSSSWKARRWSGVASVSMGISVLVWW